ncbi:pH-response regulator [Rickenella mellea]|uniref:pH-response regulator n=1 Tax=Rickenella mellea TaxID=50990 RepID=A0A4Y7QEM5_9AGAM|nr:pH-response regulator [Rickenella mellea]
MSNQVSIPFKTTSPIPIKQAISDYILSNHPYTSPDAFAWDITQWEQLRSNCNDGAVRVDKTQAFIKYHAQLVFILTKLPSDIGLSIPYHSAFSPSSPPESISSLVYERAALLFNLAATYSQLALSEDRSHPDGIKRGTVYYQNAAGTLSYLINNVIPVLAESLPNRQPPVDLSIPFLRGLEYLMLAQAQECAWQRAVMDQYKNGVIAKLSAKAASLYRSSLATFRDAPSSAKVSIPPEWLVHIETKQYHFSAAAQYRKSIDDLEGNRYGQELARLLEAQASAKKGYDIARRGLASKPVLQDIKSLLDIVEKSVKRAECDNDLIYHEDVPPSSALNPIQEAGVAQSIVPPGLQDPKSAVGGDGVVFGDLVGWGARVAIDIYRDRRENWLKAEVYDRVEELDDVVSQTLQALNLPASLDALDRPIGLPPSLLKKAEEVRQEDGPSRVDKSIANVEMLAEQNRTLLDEAMDLLDEEASEDEHVRKQTTRPLQRPLSYEANKELTSKEKRYRQILEQAAESDELVKDKWAEWEDIITRLTFEEADLEKWVPSSTARKYNNPQTQTHARALRVHLEALDDVQRSRAQIVQRARQLADADNIQPRIMREASAIERWTEVEPVMFEDTIDQELSKYEKFKDAVDDGQAKQAEILEDVKLRTEQFLLTRRDDKSVKDREHALQSLDLAYHKYREITRNLDEGLKFYNDLANILSMFKEACKAFVRSRRDEVTTSVLSESLSQTRISQNDIPAMAGVTTHRVGSPPARTKDEHAPATRNPKIGLDLPPPDSDEWESTPTSFPQFAAAANSSARTPNRSRRKIGEPS